MGFEDGPGVVALIGNGVSMVYSEHLGCGPLAHILESQLESRLGSAGLRHLAEVGKKLLADAQTPWTSFEGLLGPLDRLGDALQSIERLSSIAGGPDLDAKYQDVQRHIRNLYLRGSSIVLTQIANHSKKEVSRPEWGRYVQFLDWLFEISRPGILRCFTLNYDILLDGYFMGLVQSGIVVSDQAYGASGSELLALPNGDELEVLPLRLPCTPDYVPKPEMAVLHHLHGSIQWVRFGGRVYKAIRLDDIRNRGFLVDGTEPMVVLTDRKSQVVERWPFSESYMKFGDALRQATGIVVAGYGFGDEPVNHALRSALHDRYSRNHPTKIMILSSKTEAEMLRLLADDPHDPYLAGFLTKSLTHVNGHLPEALGTPAMATWWPG